MVLNVTNKTIENFSCFQRLALKGEPLISRYVRTYEEFETLYDSSEGVQAVMVDESMDEILVNDIMNCVTCPVVTPRIETYVDSEIVNFIEYGKEDI